MTPASFVKALGLLAFENTFNPYSDCCPVHDLADASRRRSHALLSILEAATQVDIDSLWIGRDLGYRGGRRTGLALTDDIHLDEHADRWDVTITRPTKGPFVKERTAAVIWKILSEIQEPIFLWNIFPLHPHHCGVPFSNRHHTAQERQAGEALLSDLIHMLSPRRLIGIGNEAAQTVHRLAGTLRVLPVRHPSYGGEHQFVSQIGELYDLCHGDREGIEKRMRQGSLFPSMTTILL